MRKIRLSDTDLELFDIEVSPADYTFYTKHKDAFKTMWREQGKPFWTRFVITFRSFTVKHGVIKQMNIDAPKFQNLIDQAFIFIHEQFVDGKENTAKNFIEDIARLAQNQDKFPALDSKSFSKDPFYARDTRELFRQFFGSPDQKSSYLKVYILSPVFLRFGGSVCRCLVRWVDAECMDKNDDSYWTPPTQHVPEKSSCVYDTTENAMCTNCIDECGTKFFQEKICGGPGGPRFLSYWSLGDPRFTDNNNPLFAPHCDPKIDWRDNLSAETFRSFMQYARATYGTTSDKCTDCVELKKNRDKIVNACRKKKKKKSKDTESIKDCDEPSEKDNQVKEEKSTNETKSETTNVAGGESKSKKRKNRNKKVKEDKKEENEEKEKKEEKKQEAKEVKKEEKKEAKKPVKVELPQCCANYDCTVADGFRVFRDKRAPGVTDITIIPRTTMTEEEEAKHLARIRVPFFKEKKNKYLMHTKMIRERIKGLPMRFEWWEGRGFVIAVLDYEKDERSHVNHSWTNFSLKVEGFDELPMKRTMLKLLLYVAKRKRRPSKSWMIDVDDVITCILPEDPASLQDQSICILKEKRYDDDLTQSEADSLTLHQPYLNLNTILMGLQDKEASNMLVEKGGKERLKKIFKHIANKQIYGNNYQCHQANKIRADNPQRNGANVIWDQMVEDPDAFEFTVLIGKNNEKMMTDLGLKKIDIRYYLSNVNPFLPLCPNCKTVAKVCRCRPPKETQQKVIDFLEQSCYPVPYEEDSNSPSGAEDKSKDLIKEETESKEKPVDAADEKGDSVVTENEKKDEEMDTANVDHDKEKEEKESESGDSDSGKGDREEKEGSKAGGNDADADTVEGEKENISINENKNSEIDENEEISEGGGSSEKGDEKFAISKAEVTENHQDGSDNESSKSDVDVESDNSQDGQSASNKDSSTDDDKTDSKDKKPEYPDKLIKEKLSQAYSDRSEIEGLSLDKGKDQNDKKKDESKDSADMASKAKFPDVHNIPSDEAMSLKELKAIAQKDKQRRRKELKQQKKKGKKGEHGANCTCSSAEARAARQKELENSDSKLNVTFDQAYAYVHGKVSKTDEMKDKMAGMDKKTQDQFHERVVKSLKEAKIEDIQNDLKEIGAYYTREQVIQMKKDMEKDFMRGREDRSSVIMTEEKQVKRKETVITMSMTVTSKSGKGSKVPVLLVTNETKNPLEDKIKDVTEEVEAIAKAMKPLKDDFKALVRREKKQAEAKKLLEAKRQKYLEGLTDAEREEARREVHDNRKYCSNCRKKEEVRRDFQKCKKCKDENVVSISYYCGRDCQVEDWKRHKREHLEKRLIYRNPETGDVFRLV